MKKSFAMIWSAAAMMGFAACSNESEQDLVQQQPTHGNPVCLTTRAAGSALPAGSSAGIYMVYGGEMRSTDNYLNNLQLTVGADGTWQPAETIYWRDNQTQASFYAYYPYTGELEDARSLSFSVREQQTTADALRASDLLWGRAEAQQPTSNAVDLTLNHLLSNVIVRVVPGEGFKDGEVTDQNIQVKLCGVLTQARVDLSNGEVRLFGSTGDITPYPLGNQTYQCIVVPQQVGIHNLVTLQWNGQEYTLRRAFTFESGKQYTLTLTMNKTQGGINIGIGDWEIVDEDFGGTVS